MYKIISIVCILITSSQSFGFDFSGTIQSNGISRNFVLHSSGSSVSTNLPVVIILHGDGGSGQGMKNSTDFDATADANNFMAVYPSSTNQLGNGIWNKDIDNNYIGEPDDVLFISDLIDYLCATYEINANKVYVVGHSGGAFMAYHLAVKLNSKIAAIAPVAGSMYDNSGTYLGAYLGGPNFVSIPICHIHGDNDNTVDYPDADFIPNDYEEWPLTGFSPVTCGTLTYENSAITTIVTGVQRIPFCENGAGSKEIVLIRLVGKGHEWPNVANFDVEQYIWNFCNAYQLSTGINCSTAALDEVTDFNQIIVYPNPTNSSLNFKGIPAGCRIELLDLTGKSLLNDVVVNGESELLISHLMPAIYLLKFTDNDGNVWLKRIVKE